MKAWAAGLAPRGPRGARGDWRVAFLVAVPQVLITWLASRHQHGHRPLDVLGFGLLLAGPVALLWRRRQPVGVMLVTLVAALGYHLAEYPYGPAFIALIVAFFTAVTRGHRLAAWLAGLGGYSAYFVLVLLLELRQRPSPQAAAGVAAWLLVLLVVSEVARLGRERAAEAARSRELQERRRAGDERLRIARELHDVLAHNISLINVQAGVALYLMDEQPEQTRTALTAIKQASNDALRELRGVLDLLRQTDEASPRTPAPGLAGLDELVAKAAATGLQVHTRVRGTPRSLPGGVDLAAYRIVQEALTNVTRHAGRAEVTVELGWGDRDLAIRVDDDGRGTPVALPTPGGGSGIRGMRERAVALGGHLEAGPRPGGGYRVEAHLPLNGGPA